MKFLINFRFKKYSFADEIFIKTKTKMTIFYKLSIRVIPGNLPPPPSTKILEKIRGGKLGGGGQVPQFSSIFLKGPKFFGASRRINKGGAS